MILKLGRRARGHFATFTVKNKHLKKELSLAGRKVVSLLVCLQLFEIMPKIPKIVT